MIPVKTLEQVYGVDAFQLPLINLTTLENKQIAVLEIVEAKTPLGEGYRITATFPDSENRFNILTQPNVVTEVLLKVSEDGNLPILVTIEKAPGKRYFRVK